MNGKLKLFYKKLLASDCNSSAVRPLSAFSVFSIGLLEKDFEINRLTTVTTEERNKAVAITKRVTISVEASL